MTAGPSGRPLIDAVSSEAEVVPLRPKDYAGYLATQHPEINVQLRLFRESDRR
jgi:hypothetical protein